MKAWEKFLHLHISKQKKLKYVSFNSNLPWGLAEETPIQDLRNLRGTWRQGLTNETSGRREWCGDAPSCNKNTQLWKCHLTCAVVTVPSAVKRPIAELDTVCLKNWICDDRCLSTQQIISLQEKNKPYSSDLEVRS